VFTPLKQTTAAGFGQLQIPIGERVVLRGGLRYEHFALSVSDYIRPAAYAAVAANNALGYQAFVLPALNVTGGNFNYSALTANLGATVKLSRPASLRRLLAGLRLARCRRLHAPRRHLDRLCLPGHDAELPAGQPQHDQLRLDRARGADRQQLRTRRARQLRRLQGLAPAISAPRKTA
jgi:hypothetical protein